MESGDAAEFLAAIEGLVDAGAWRYAPPDGPLALTPGAERLLDVSPETETLQRSPAAFVHDDDRAAIEADLAACRDRGEAFERDVRIVTDAERTRWCRIAGERVGGDADPHLRGAIADVSKERRDHQRLTVLNRVIRHNIANAVTVIQAHADLLGNDVDADPADRDFFRDRPEVAPDAVGTQQHLRSIVETAQGMAETAEKARTIERILADPPTTRAVPIEELLVAVVESVGTEYPDVSLAYDCPDLTVRTDPDRLRLAIEELVENAIAHHDGETPRIVLEAGRDAGGGTRVSIIDDGPGIPDIERAVLTRAEETPLRHGSGIGLWMVHWFVGQLGGHVTIETVDPRGTRVDVVLPSEPQRVDDR